eukprot:6175511-Pleurochrysis_carterae.AAC.1
MHASTHVHIRAHGRKYAPTGAKARARDHTRETQGISVRAQTRARTSARRRLCAHIRVCTLVRKLVQPPAELRTNTSKHIDIEKRRIRRTRMQACAKQRCAFLCRRTHLLEEALSMRTAARTSAHNCAHALQHPTHLSRDLQDERAHSQPRPTTRERTQTGAHTRTRAHVRAHIGGQTHAQMLSHMCVRKCEHMAQKV